jgi:hypothetical protein
MEFECNVCFKRFTRKDNLERHKESVHGAGSFSCDKCFKTFNRKDAYVRHERTCSIICKYCDTEFESGIDLFIHVQSQHSAQKFCCSKCAKKYIEKRDLKKHQQKCSQTINGFTLRWIINRIRNGVKGLRHYNFHYIFFRDRLHKYKTILAVTYLSKLIRLSHVFIDHLLNVIAFYKISPKYFQNNICSDQIIVELPFTLIYID